MFSLLLQLRIKALDKLHCGSQSMAKTLNLLDHPQAKLKAEVVFPTPPLKL